MKKTFLYLAIFFCFFSLYSAEPLVKFYLNDGSTKQYNLSEIDSLGVIDKKNNYVMRIHYSDSLIAYYPTEIIGSIKFEKDDIQRDILNVYIFSYPKPYKLSSIDSLVFYIDQWQPLTIGSQVWMLKNLNVDHYRNGDSIPKVRYSVEEWDTLKTGAWCIYGNYDSLRKIYGNLYNWFAVNDKRGLSPAGWHVASDSEWTKLTAYLGGTNKAGGKLKEAGITNHWDSPNQGGTNESGFSALPGASVNTRGGTCDILGFCGFWWSSTEDNDTSAWSWDLSYGSTSAFSFIYIKEKGFSVRCVKDGK